MKPAAAPRQNRRQRRLLLLDAQSRRVQHDWAENLSARLEPGDLVIVNDAATLPASFVVRSFAGELRLVKQCERDAEYWGVLFGAGDYRTPTELRPAPPTVAEGQRLELLHQLEAEVIEVDPRSPRLVRIRFSLSGAALLTALYRAGRPIQYAHVPAPLALWDVQNRFAARPWAFEAPSAGFAIDGEQLTALARRGVRLASVTHAAGISSTGAPELDRLLPLPETFEIPTSTARELALSERSGGRVIAIGTSVVRALEASAARHGRPRAGRDEATLLLHRDYRPRVVDAVLSGMHEMGSSHFALLESFADARLLTEALECATRAGYVAHEFGDVCLVFAAPRQRALTSAAA